MNIKERIQKELTDPTNQINTELVVTAETNRRMTFKSLYKLLDKMNYHTNFNLIKGGNWLKKKDKRVGMFCFLEQGAVHTHAHILLKIPLKYDHDKVIDIMREGFKRLDQRKDQKYNIYKTTARDIIGHVIYASKQLNSNYDPDDYSFVIL